jgi:tetratricopeptide (TPR) repeat protein
MFRHDSSRGRGTSHVFGAVFAIAIVGLATFVALEFGGLEVDAERSTHIVLAAPPQLPEPEVEPFSELERADLIEMADVMMRRISKGELEVFRRTFWVERFVDRCLGGLELGAKEREAFESGVREVVFNSDFLARSWSNWEFEFLRYDEVQGHPRLFFRVIGSDVGLNYLVWHAAKDDTGRLRFYDYYSFAAGETLSSIGRRFAMLSLASRDASFADQLRGTDRDLYTHMLTIRRMGQAVAEARYEDAIAAYQSLPESLRHDKSVLLVYLRALANADLTDSYLVIVERYRRLYPDDESLPLLLIDYYATKGDTNRVLDEVDRLETRVGGDPYLDSLRAHTCIVAHQFDRAESFVRRAIRLNPNQELTYWTFVNLGLESGRYALVSEALRMLETRFRIVFEYENLASDSLYIEFAESPEGRAFLFEDSVRRVAEAHEMETKTAPSPPVKPDSAPLLDDGLEESSEKSSEQDPRSGPSLSRSLRGTTEEEEAAAASATAVS